MKTEEKVLLAAGGVVVLGGTIALIASAAPAKAAPPPVTGTDTLSGVITDSVTGSPLSGATAYLSPATGATLTAPTNAHGQFSFSSLAAGPHYLSALAPGYQTLSPLISLTIKAGANTQDIKLTQVGVTPPATGTLGGVIRDSATSSPIPNATVYLAPATGATLRVTANASGAYSFSGVSPGPYALSAVATGYNVTAVNITIAAGPNTRNIQLAAQVAAPYAQFAVSPASGVAPLTVQFTDQSTGNPTAWAWDFGDGSGSSQQDPSHTFQSAGTFTVKLTVTNAAGSSTFQSNIVVSAVSGTKPVASFLPSTYGGDAPLTVQFTNNSLNNPTSQFWEFGDGEGSTAVSPSHVYQTAGSYNVSLMVTNAAGSSSASQTITVTVVTPPPPPVTVPTLIEGSDNGFTITAGSWRVAPEGLYVLLTLQNLATRLSGSQSLLGTVNVYFNITGKEGGVMYPGYANFPGLGQSGQVSILITQNGINLANDNTYGPGYRLLISQITDLAVAVSAYLMPGYNPGGYSGVWRLPKST